MSEDSDGEEELKQEDSEFSIDNASSSMTIDNELGVISKLECMSAAAIVSKQRETITHFAWDPAYTSDVIKLTSRQHLQCSFKTASH